ncbi:MULTISPECIES: hypothetical protein [unclassified Streptomyces]|uniref:hypothetical protein n=1 Tax=unclassified Streptomyces TaxID=2593676 RepID=UPI0036BC2604
MHRGEFGALALSTWMVAFALLVTTVSAQRRLQRTWLERLLWPWAKRRAWKSRAALEARIEAVHREKPPQPVMDYLQREDVLFRASSWAVKTKTCTTLLLSFNAGGALAAVGVDGEWWHKLFACFMFVLPAALTMGFSAAALRAGMQRWTTECVTTTVRRAYEALLVPFEAAGPEPRADRPYQAPHIPSVEALSGFARALEEYAVSRALPDRRNPMPLVVRHCSAAASHVRVLRDGLELEGESSREQVLREVERMLEALAHSRLNDLAPAGEEETLLDVHRDRTTRRRQTAVLAIFTLALGLISCALLLSSPALGIAVTTVVATFIVASWGRNLGFGPLP